MGFVRYELEDGAGGGDAFVCSNVIKVVGVEGLVWDMAVEAAKAGTVDDGTGAMRDDC